MSPVGAGSRHPQAQLRTAVSPGHLFIWRPRLLAVSALPRSGLGSGLVSRPELGSTISVAEGRSPPQHLLPAPRQAAHCQLSGSFPSPLPWAVSGKTPLMYIVGGVVGHLT